MTTRGTLGAEITELAGRSQADGSFPPPTYLMLTVQIKIVPQRAIL